MFSFKEDNKNDLLKKLCLGIDFGTTNSCISVWYKNRSIIIPDIDGSDVIPTVIEIKDNKNKVVGKEAYIRKDIFNNKKTFLVYEIKKIIGKKYSELDQEYINNLGYGIGTNDKDDIIIYNDYEGIIYKYKPEEIASHLFKSFKTRAESYLSSYFKTEIEIEDAIISVPAKFGNSQRQIIKICAESAGFNVKRMINEPTAAAICYGIGKTEQEKNIMVYDFGGGTLDISILNVSDSIYKVLCSCGNSCLGGSDFDSEIMNYCIRDFIIQNYFEEDNNNSNFEKIDNSKKKEERNNEINEYIIKIKLDNCNNLQKLKYLSEQAKIKLSTENLVVITIEDFFEEKKISTSISRDIFQNICKDLVWLYTNPMRDSLENSGLTIDKIDEIIMVGGMTKSPLIRRNVELCMNKNVNYSINPDNVVSIGAAIHGYMINNNIDIADKLLLVDRTSLSVGVELSDGTFDTLIPRGTIIPSNKRKKYTTNKDNVEYIDIKIYEGERKFVKDNMLIGDFRLSGIEKQKKGIPRIGVEFYVDIDGIMTVKAEDLENSTNKNSICITNNVQHLSKEEIEEIVTKAKIMDELDKTEKNKKRSYDILLNNSEIILLNVKSENLKIPNNIREEVIENVTIIMEWLKQQNYTDITVEKYKELIKDYKINYSIYLIINDDKITKELEDADNNDTKEGTEIFDNDIKKKFENEITFLRNILNECDDIKKEFDILKSMSYTEREKIGNFNENDFEEINSDFNEIYNKILNEVMINIFVNDEINEEILKETIENIKKSYLDFKTKFNDFNEKFNHINKLIKSISNKEETILTNIENIHEDIQFFCKIIKEQINNFKITNKQQINQKQINQKELKEELNELDELNQEELKEEELKEELNELDELNQEELNELDELNQEELNELDELDELDDKNNIDDEINDIIDEIYCIDEFNNTDNIKKDVINKKDLINEIKMNEKIMIIKNKEIKVLEKKLSIINNIESEIHALKSCYKEIKYERIKYFLFVIDTL